MNKKLILAVALLAVGFGKIAIAQENIAQENIDSRWYVAPAVSYIWNDSDRQTERDSLGLSVGVGKAIDQNFNLELKGFYNDLSGENKNSGRQNSWDVLGSTLDLQYYFNRNTLSPYAVVGAGFANSKSGGENAFGLIGEAGLGLAYKINDSISLRSDVRYRYNDNFNKNLNGSGVNEYNDMVANFGVVIPFGIAKTKTNNQFATIEKDSDNDGVFDSADQCPNTKAGSKVNQAGCNLPITLKGVNFKANSAILTTQSKIVLDKLASEVNADSYKRELEIQGHASLEGKKSYNLILSQKRAQTVLNYLRSKNVTNPMVARGYGSEVPVADNKTKEGRSKNRRVELVWK